MRGQLIARMGSLALLLLVASSLVWTSAADEPNQAGLVVQFGDGRVETRCVSFEGEQITGAELLTLSGLDAIVDPSTGMGITVCRIEEEGCSYPAEPCFCQCMGGGQCAYWNYFFRDAGQVDWTYSALGAAIRAIKPGSVEGWVWGDGHSPPGQEMTFKLICAPPTPSPTETREQPVTVTAPPTDMATVPATTPAPVAPTLPASETPRPTDLPTGQPATAAPSPTLAAPTPSPATLPGPETGSRPSSLLPFGLMIAGLALVAGLVWFLRR